MLELSRMARGGRADSIRSERAGAKVTGAAQRMIDQMVEHGPSRMAELARRAGTDPGIVSRQVDALVGEGLVERRADPEDGRAWLLHFTPRGRRAADRLREVQDEIFGELLGEWSTVDLEQLATLMERLAQDLRHG